MTNNYNQRLQPSLQASLVRWLFACSFMLLSLFAGTSAYSQCTGLPSSAGTASAAASSICSGTTASLSVAGASNDLGVVYQWYSSTSTGGPYTTLVTGATDTLYTTGSLTFNTYYVLSVKCSNTGDSVLTNEVAITVLPNLPVSVVLASSATTVCTGTSITLTANPVNGGSTPSYTFNVNGSPVQSGASATYTYTPSNGDLVNVVIASNATCATGSPATSNVVTITVNSASASISPASPGFCTGGSVTLTASATPAAVSYLWSDASTSSTLVVSTAGTYTVTTTDGNGCTAVANRTVIQNDLPVVSISGNATLCLGTSNTLTANASVTNGTLSYVWRLNGTPIGGATSSTYVAAVAGTYTVVATSTTGCSTTSANFVLAADASPLAGTYTIGSPASCTQFTSLANFITAINTRGVSANVILNIPSAYAETAPTGGYTLKLCGLASNLQTGPTRTLTIKKSSVSNPVITASIGTSTTLDAIFRVVGTDNVTVDGITFQENAGNLTATTQMEWGFAVLKCSGDDGANNVVIQNCTITLNKANTASVGIYSNNHTEASTTQLIATALGTPAGSEQQARNRVNMINNTISNVYGGIFMNGNGNAAPNNANISLNDTLPIISGNNISNFGGGTTAATAISIAAQRGYSVANNIISGGQLTTGGVTGINGGNAPWGSITGNNVTLFGSPTTAATIGITMGNTGGNAGNPNICTISNNTIQGGAVFTTNTTGSISGITGGGNGTGSILTMNLNTIQNITLGGAATTAAIFGINHGGADNVNITNNTINNLVKNSGAGTSVTMAGINNANAIINYVVTGNTVSNISVRCSTATASTVSGIVSTVASNVNMANNNVSNIYLYGPGTATTTNVYGIRESGNSLITNVKSISNNTITSIVSRAAGNVSGISHGAGSITINGNTVSVVRGDSSASATNAFGINEASATASNIATINGNNIFTISGQSTGNSTGVLVAMATTSTANVFNNTISRDTVQGASTANGINITAIGTANVYSNKVYGLVGNAAGSLVNGIAASSITTALNAYNNIVGSFANSFATGANAMAGFNLTNTTGALNITNNTVSLSGTGGAGFGASGVSVNTGATLNLRNNIIINKAVPVGTGFSTALRFSSTVLTGFAAASNNNLYYTLATPTAAQPLFYNGTTSYATLSAYKTFVGAARESNAYYEDAPFLSSVGANATFLHINPATSTNIEGNAIPVATITTDFDGDARNATSPDIGADEGNFTNASLVITSVVASPAIGQCTAVNHTITAVIQPSALPITSVTLSYSYNGTAQTPIVMSNGGSGNTYTGVIPAAVVPTNATVTWSVTATDGSVSKTFTGASYQDNYLLSVTAGSIANPSQVCAGTPSTLTAFSTGNVQVGTGTTANSTSGITPYSGLWENSHHQYIVRASELTAAGIVAGPISQLRLDATSAVTTTALQGYTISIAHTNLTDLSAAYATGSFTTVFGPTAVTPTLGLNTYNFGSSFNWNGAQNIVIDICFTNDAAGTCASCFSSSSAVNFNTTAYVSSRGNYADNLTMCSGTGGTSATASARPNFYFAAYTAPVGFTVNWLNSSNASVGTTNPLILTPAATNTYTAIFTNTQGCTFASSPVTLTVNPIPNAPTSAGSTQCGVGVPTATVSSTTSGVAFNWYTASTGGSPVQSSTANTLQTYSVSATSTLYVSAINLTTNCESARTPVLLTVNQPDAITASVVPATPVCPGTSVTLNVANTAPSPVNVYTYTWNGPGVVNQVGASITFNAPSAGVSTYTVTAVDGSCAIATTATVTTINPPVISSITATPATICAGSTVQLTALTPVIGAGNRIFNDSSATASTTYSAPWYSLWSNKNQQIMILASELTAAGISPGNLTGIDFSVTAGTIALTNFSMGLAQTSQTTMATPLASGAFTTVFSTPSLTQVIGNQLITFSSPFTWDGTSNVVIKICFGNPASTITLSSTSKMSATSFVSQYVSYNTVNTDGNALCSATGSTILTYNVRPTMRFYGQTVVNGPGSLGWAWNNGAGTGNTVSVTPSTTTTYTVTATNNTTGCTSTANVTVNVNPAPTAPSVTNSTQCGVGIPVASVASTSGLTTPQFNWYSAQTGGTLLQGPPPAAGALENYYTNNFNGASVSPATISGSASLTGGTLQLTPNSLSQLGGITIPASGRNADKYNVAFNLITGGGGGADGMSYSFGDDASATSTTVNAEHGSGTKLSLSFDEYDATGTAVQGIRLSYGTGVISAPGSTVGVNGILAYSSNVSWVGTNVPVILDINAAGQATVTVNGVAIFTNVQLPPAYLAANKSNWVHVFKARTGGLSMLHAIDNLTIQQSGVSAGYTTYQTSISATTPFWVSEINQATGCQSARSLVTASVNSPDVVNITSSADPSATICVNQPVTLTAVNTGTINNYSYTWNGTAGSGATNGTTGSSITVTPIGPGSYTYTATAVDGSCTAIATKTITVLALPTIQLTAPVSTTICSGTAITALAQNALVGAGNRILNDSSSTSTTYSAPWYSLWSNKNQQILILASELTAAGISAGNLTRIDFSITSGTIALTNFSMALAQTAQTTMATPLASGAFTTVFSTPSLAQVIGNQGITFTTPFNWNGTSNIVLKICFGNPSSTVTLSSGAKMSATSFVSQYVSYTTTSPGTDGNAICGSTGLTTLTYSTRPTMRIYGQTTVFGNSLNWSWSDGTSVVSTTNTLNASPTSNTTYTVTGTNAGGCSGSASFSMTVNPLPTPPIAVPGTRCGFGLVNIGATSTSGVATPIFSWYTVASGGTPIQTGPSTTLNSVSTGTNTTYYVTEVNPLTNCESSPRTVVLQTVTPTDPLAITGGVSAICLGESLNFGSTQTGSNQNYTLTWTASPAVGSGLSAGPLGPVQTWYTNDFASSTGSGLLSGNASLTGGKVQLTPNTASQLGGITIPNPTNISADALQVNFDLTLTQTGAEGADGLSYSFGDDVSATATVPNAENGTGTKLKVAFDSYGGVGAGQAGIYLMYNCNVTNQTPTTTGVLAFVANTSFVNTTSAVSITVTQAGLATVSLNGVPVISNVQLPAAYLTANRSTWQHVIKARTGAISQIHAIDNLVINYQNTISTPVTGSSLSVTPTIAGTYVYTLTGVDGSCSFQTAQTVVVNPAAAAINAGADISACSGSSVTLNASGGGLIPALRFTEVLWQVNAGTGPTGAGIPAWASTWYTANGGTTADMIEITNLGIGSASTDGISIEFWNAASTTSGLPNYTYTIPSGAPLMNSGGLLYFSHGGASVITDLTNRFYTNGINLNNGSGTAGGMIMRKGGLIIDAVAVSGYTFPAASGVTGADWSGTLPSNSGLSGTVLVAADNNTSSSWSNTSATQLASVGTLNAGLVANLPSLGTVSWTSNPPGFTSTNANPTFGPLTANTTFTVQFNNGTCSSFDDVVVTVISTIPTPLVATNRDTICSSGSATLTVTNPIGTAIYQWMSSPTGNPGTFTNISGAIGTTYVIPTVVLGSTDQTLYYQVSGTCGVNTTTSATRVIYVANPIISSASSATRCGAGAVQLTATGNGTFDWYNAATAGTFLGTGSPFNTNVLGNTLFYVEARVGSCRTASRLTSTVLVNPATAITAIATPATICAGASTTLSVSSTEPNYVYTWNGGPTANTYTVSPTTTTTYTVNANNPIDGCGAVALVTVNVNPLPSVPVITATGATACVGGAVSLTASSSGPGLVTIGTAATTNVTTGSSPYTGNWEGAKIQYLIRASELTAANIVAGPITSLAFNVTSATTTFAMSSYSIKMGTTAATALSAYQTGLSTVYTAPSTIIPTVGLNTYTFTAPFTWNGTSNIIVEVCHNNDPTGSCASCFGGTSTVAATTTAFVSSYGQYADNTAPANPWDLCSQISTGTVVTSSARPDMRFNANVSSSGASTFNWSTGQTGSTVSVTPVTGTNTYTVTATSAQGCTSLPGSITITPNALPTPSVTDSLGNLVLTGTVFCSPNSVNLYAKDLTGAYAAGYPAGTSVEWLGYSISGDPLTTFVNSTAGSTFQARVTLGGTGCIGLSNTIIVDTRSVTVTPVITPAACGNTNGKVKVTVATAPNPPYRYQWLSGATIIRDVTNSNLKDSIMNLAPGTYTLNIYDNVGGLLSCSTTGLTYVVTGTTGAIVNADSTNVSCFGLTDGSATANIVSGGTAPFSYLWSTGGTTATISGLGAGVYTVTVTDALGCTSTGTTIVLAPTEITAVVTSTNACFGQSNGSASVVISGGSGTYSTIDWYSLDFLTNYGAGLSVSGLPGGTLSLVIVDNAGCSPVTGILVGASILNPEITETPEITVSSFAPSSGAVGSSVVITGSGFTGATSVSFNGTSAIAYTVNSDIQITATVPTGATTGTVSVQVGSCSGTSSGSFTVISTGTLNLKAYIQGYLDVLTTTMTSVVLNQTGLGSLTETDNITVEFHNATAPYALAASSTVMLNTNGTATVTIPGSLIGGSYYIAIIHRSALETWSANPVALSTVTNYDFTTSSSQAFGDNMVEGPTGVWSLYTGDVDNTLASGTQDGLIDLSDFLLLDTDVQNFIGGYVSTDLNGNGIVDLDDFLIQDANVQNFISVLKP